MIAAKRATSLGHEMAVFAQMAAKRVGQLRALPDQHFPGAEQHGARLLIGRFDSDRPHRRPLRRLNDRFRVGRVVLLTLDERLHIDRRNEPHLMPLGDEEPAPIVGCRASFHRHNASRQLRHHLNEIRARQLATEDNTAVARRRMQLESMFCEIDADDVNFCQVCLLFCWPTHHRQLGTS